jgi:SPFH domain / Band 7 family
LSRGVDTFKEASFSLVEERAPNGDAAICPFAKAPRALSIPVSCHSGRIESRRPTCSGRTSYTSQLAQVTLRSVCGQGELDELLAERDKINARIQTILDAQTDPWGIKVVLVELKHIDLPQEMQRAMAKQAEADRERRAKVIHAEGEFQASQKLADAAEIIAKHPMALHLRFLQSLVEVSAEKNSTIIFPVP